MKSRILVFNAGSSSLKFSVFQAQSMELLLNGEVEGLFDKPKLWVKEGGMKKEINKTLTPGIPTVLPIVLDEVNNAGKGEEITGISHRVVHGGKIFKGPTLITPEVINQLKELIPLGIDTFDSSYPTRAARHGLLLTNNGGIKVEQRLNSLNFGPIEEECRCPTCKQYTLAYLHHLFKAKEMTGLILTTIHNLHFMVNLMRETREKILNNEI